MHVEDTASERSVVFETRYNSMTENTHFLGFIFVTYLHRITRYDWVMTNISYNNTYFIDFDIILKIQNNIIQNLQIMEFCESTILII